uniref:Uncharacterized protein n=1 Tax=Geospiza parvula TaxID=87175 RepID=A0A8C3NLC5_GEOPR
MAQALLFLPLLILGRAMAASIITPALADGERALLAELAGLAEPSPGRAPGVPCQTLHPHHLPGFSRLPALPRGLARAALTLALLGAGCAPQAEAETLELARDVGTATAAAHGATSEPGQHGAHATPSRENREFPRLQPCRGTERRHRREDEDACSPAGEREAHRVLDWVPGVSVFYNLGTSVYFAFQGCEATASTRALEAAEDLGYAGLAALTGGLGGPVAMGVQLGLQPGLKAGVRALIGYFTSAGEPSPVPTAHSGPEPGHAVAAGLGLSLSL